MDTINLPRFWEGTEIAFALTVDGKPVGFIARNSRIDYDSPELRDIMPPVSSAIYVKRDKDVNYWPAPDTEYTDALDVLDATKPNDIAEFVAKRGGQTYHSGENYNVIALGEYCNIDAETALAYYLGQYYTLEAWTLGKPSKEDPLGLKTAAFAESGWLFAETEAGYWEEAGYARYLVENLTAGDGALADMDVELVRVHD